MRRVTRDDWGSGHCWHYGPRWPDTCTDSGYGAFGNGNGIGCDLHVQRGATPGCDFGDGEVGYGDGDGDGGDLP